MQPLAPHETLKKKVFLKDDVREKRIPGLCFFEGGPAGAQGDVRASQLEERADGGERSKHAGSKHRSVWERSMAAHLEENSDRRRFMS